MPLMVGVSPSWVTPVAPIGPVALGTALWRMDSRTHLTIALKARFAFRHDTMMVVTSPVPLATRDQHIADDPTRSLVEASDMVPYREQADVWLTGRAYAPAGRPVAVSVVRMALYRHGQALLDKSLHVYGERKASDVEPKPFESLPITYELAYGGVGFDDNPVGVGADERDLAPSIVHPEDAERVAGFGPISRYWKLRRGQLSTRTRRKLETVVPDVPPGFDWSYFQAAPADQRLSYLSGDEWLVLDGMHPTMLRVQTRLPKVRAVARVMPIDDDVGTGDAIAMVGDTLAIDAVGQVCTVTWRGNVTLAQNGLHEHLLVAGGIEMHGRGLDWSQARRNRIASRPPEPRPDPPRLDRSGVTIVSELPAEAMRELDDPLARTSVDVHETAPPASYRRVSELPVKGPSESQEIEGWPSYPLTGDGDEVTETKTTLVQPQQGQELLFEEVEITTIEPVDGDDATRPQRISIPTAMDTEVGGPPPIDETDLSWLEEVPLEPEDKTLIQDETPRRPSTAYPPALHPAAYEAALRGAGASQRDIDALLEWLDDE